MTTNERYALAKVIDDHRVAARNAGHMAWLGRNFYTRVEAFTGIPWFVVAAIHMRESSFNFNCHLHNGDPLSGRTVHAPAGRPLALPERGTFPYEWYESAVDALKDRDKPSRWDAAGSCLDFLEAYNGPGYQKRKINSPYLWSFTDQYAKGLFVADGKFDPNAVCKQVGCAALFKALEKERAIVLHY
jgi:lysozyme family protein